MFGSTYHGMQCRALIAKGGIRTVKVMLNQFLKAAMVILIGNLLEGLKILKNLIEPTANALPIL
ncbi:MAG: hypothetical protein A3H31_06585 [Gallionellales bacterium RIFCSPLOWO2_02_FULL_57_47]|nr:MAG: hypothetical protein A3H31_06585 [Gallionellales bacterium RIFCSPLOWO2_02_FULL_57_47]OGT17042.1 MAG: hypothetical protein A3J49_07835 [Gallionellales bacterium RIFCSPHIGHO2_02_FULL_57_16]